MPSQRDSYPKLALTKPLYPPKVKIVIINYVGIT